MKSGKMQNGGGLESNLRSSLESGAVIRPRLGREFFARDGITVAKELLGKILVHETPIGIVRGIITEVESYMGESDKGSHTYGGRRTERTEPMYHAGGTSYVYLIYGMYSCMNIAAQTTGIPQAVLLRSVIPADGESERRMIQLRQEAAARRSAAAKQSTDVKQNADVKQSAAAKQNAAAKKNADVKQSAAAKQRTDAEQRSDVIQSGGEKMNCGDGKGEPPSFGKHLADGPGKLCIAMGITRADNDVDMTESNGFYVTEGIAVKPSVIHAAKRIGIDYAEEAAEYLWRFYIEKGDIT